jgi:hypothetical protein
MRVHGVVATMLFAFLAASVRAQVPTFEAATDVVHVWVVRDSKGKPVTNLTRDTFRLLDEGKPREQSLLDEVLADIASQYVLGFAPGRDDAFHRLRVTVTRGGVKTRHRDGYYPPPPR